MIKTSKAIIQDYLNWDLKKIPKTLQNKDNIDIKASEIKNEKNYKVYKYVSVKDINIVMTNTRRLDEPSVKIEKMNDLSFYLNKKNEEEYREFVNLIQNASIEDIKELEKMQEGFEKNIPSKIKYVKDYLWQIYYIKRTNKYYMIVPMQETENQAFLYLLKKKIEDDEKNRIYVPICNLEYNNIIIENTKINTLESNLHFFTKQWPMIYEVYDKKEKASINIIGNLEIFENIDSDYKMKFETKEEINKFYILTKTLFYIQTELSNYFRFDIVLDKNGQIDFYYNEDKLDTDNLKEFYKSEIEKNLKNIEEIEKIQRILTKKLHDLKAEEKTLNTDLLNKQKQISTYLECKKSFFGRVKYFFKYNNKKKKIQEEDIVVESIQEDDVRSVKQIYSEDIEDLIYICKEVKTKTTIAGTTRLDVQNLTIKIEVLKKKIENATQYINEIESHKKSIFEFWKFTNKDEKNQLSEGVVQENNETKIEKKFDIHEDLQDFTKRIDQLQRKNLTQEEQDNILIAYTYGLELINKISNKEEITTEDLEIMKKIETLKNSLLIEHREKERSALDIIGITKNSTVEGLKENLIKALQIIEKAFSKIYLDINLPVYSKSIPKNEFTLLEINPKKLVFNEKEINLYKVNLKKGTKILAFTNIIFFYNRNKTLPVGMDYSSKVLVDFRKSNLMTIKTKTNHIIKLFDNNDKVQVTKINIIEMDV